MVFKSNEINRKFQGSILEKTESEFSTQRDIVKLDRCVHKNMLCFPSKRV